MYSKSKIDKCVKIISSHAKSDKEKKEANIIFDYWRKEHIEPLTEITIKLQEWFLIDFRKDFYLAQRLKRKPQILRKLIRFSTRLTQLQDIGGCRIIVNTNKEVEEIKNIIETRNKKSHYFKIIHYNDYRERGRDDSGYRALHIIVKRKGVFIEIQVRSRIQHYWAESIERTSVIAGVYLKELKGPEIVLSYFKKLSNLLYDVENGNNLNRSDMDQLNIQKRKAEEIIKKQDSYKILDSHVNEQFIQSMIGKEKSLRKTKINNWMIVFDWKEGQFLHWIHLDQNPITAIRLYSEFEEKWVESDGFEVVLVSSPSVYTIQETHSHYFGIENLDDILESLDQIEYRLRSLNKLNTNSVFILEKFYSHKFIGKRKASLNTLKNHFCQKINDLDKDITLLIEKEFVVKEYGKDLYSLNKGKIKEIEKLISRSAH